MKLKNIISALSAVILTVSCTIFSVYAEDYEYNEYGELLGALGDVNYDGEINIFDAALVLEYSAKSNAGEDMLFYPDDEKINQKCTANADLDNDSKITAYDASLILNYSAELGAGMNVRKFEDTVVSVTESESVFNIVYGEPVQREDAVYIPVIVESDELPFSVLDFVIEKSENYEYEVLQDYDEDRYYGKVDVDISMTAAQGSGRNAFSWASSIPMKGRKNLRVIAVQNYDASLPLPEITVISAGYVQNIDKVVKYSVSSSEKTALKQGDADNSRKVDILDVITVNKAILGKEKLTDEQLKTIDFNGDGKPDASDSLKLMKLIVGLITSLTE